RAVRLGAPDDSEVVISPDLSIPLGVLKHTRVAHSTWTKDRLRGGRRLSGKKTLIGSSHSHAAPTSFSLRRHSSTRMRILPHRGDILPRVKPVISPSEWGWLASCRSTSQPAIASRKTGFAAKRSRRSAHEGVKTRGRQGDAASLAAAAFDRSTVALAESS